MSRRKPGPPRKRQSTKAETRFPACGTGSRSAATQLPQRLDGHDNRQSAIRNPQSAMKETAMFELRPLSPSAIPSALAKAERYRLLNEGGQAESICQDVLAVDPDNQDALAMMILAITDQFRDEATAMHVGRAERLLPQLHDPYTRAYYAALIHERRARAAIDA